MIRVVLIETYWNVNENEFLKKTKSFSVLIETYWNVNLIYNRKSVMCDHVY